MIRFLRNGIGKPANGGIIPIGLNGYKINENNRYDPKKAKEYIDQYKKITNEIPNLKLTTSPEYVVFCEFIQKELEKIGLNISIEVIPGSSLREAKANGKLDFLGQAGLQIIQAQKIIFPFFTVKIFHQMGLIIPILKIIFSIPCIMKL